MALEPLTDEQRAANLANRLRHCASVNDGLTLRFTETVPGHPLGEVRVVSKSRALAYIAANVAELAE